jgi:uncharacterized membrane protein YoaK (UPF0700 family)
MKPEDLSPEQKAEFEAAVLVSKSNMRHIIVPNVLLLLLMQAVNVFICIQFALPPPAPFFMYFMTVILMSSTVNKQLKEEADRFQEEVFKIFNQK